MLVVAALAARWFVPGRFAVGDGTPPLVLDNLRPELWSTWSHQLSGGGSTSHPMTRALDAGALALGETFGLTGPTTQALLTAACATFAAGTVTLLARGLVRPAAASFAGLVAVVNPLVLVTLPSRVPLLAIGAAAWLAHLLRASVAPAPGPGDDLAVPEAGPGRRRPSPLAVALVTLPLSALATEPLVLAGLGLAAPVVAVALAVAAGRASVGRLLRFLAWALPLGLVASSWWLVPVALTWSGWREGIAVRPAGLRAGHLAALVVPLAALGLAAVVDRRLGRADLLRRTGYRRRRVVGAYLVTALGAVTVLALPFPLWTGTVADGSSLEVPDGWEAVAAVVDGSAVAGKVLVLPVAPADGRVDARWAGRGAESVPRQLLRRPVLQRPADPLFRLPDALDHRLRRAERLLAAGDATGLAPVLDELGVSHLVVRRDLTEVPDGELTATAARLRGWRPVGRYGVADVVERVRSAPLLDAVPADADGTPPRLAWSRHGGGHYEVDVETAPGGGPFVLRLAETFGAGWAVQGLPPTWSSRHGLVAGYANGWRIEGEGNATLHLHHRPTHRSGQAALASVGAIAGAAVLTALRLARAGRGDAAPAPPPPG
jgi:hypothetical protein